MRIAKIKLCASSHPPMPIIVHHHHHNQHHSVTFIMLAMACHCLRPVITLICVMCVCWKVMDNYYCNFGYRLTWLCAMCPSSTCCHCWRCLVHFSFSSGTLHRNAHICPHRHTRAYNSRTHTHTWVMNAIVCEPRLFTLWCSNHGGLLWSCIDTNLPVSLLLPPFMAKAVSFVSASFVGRYI